MKLDFWQLSRDPADKVTALIAGRVLGQDERLLVVSSDAAQREAISRALWSAGPETFLANGDADINQCPPGGDAGVRALADLLGREAKALDPAHGEEMPPRIALIDEARCIGCTLCIQACPVDAIIGAAKLMHTVIESECTGCDLCLPPCPVDCIDMIEPEPRLEDWVSPAPRSPQADAGVERQGS